MLELTLLLKNQTICVKQIATALTECYSYRELHVAAEPLLLSMGDTLAHWNLLHNRRARDATATRSQEEQDLRDTKVQRLMKGLFACITAAENANKREGRERVRERKRERIDREETYRDRDSEG